MSTLGLYNLLEDEREALASAALARLQAEWPAVAAALGARGQDFFLRALDAFIDVIVTGSDEGWGSLVDELLPLEATQPGVLVDLPLGLVRVACERLAEQLVAPDTNRVSQRRALFQLESAGRIMSVSAVARQRQRLSESPPAPRGVGSRPRTGERSNAPGR